MDWAHFDFFLFKSNVGNSDPHVGKSFAISCIGCRGTKFEELAAMPKSDPLDAQASVAGQLGP